MWSVIFLSFPLFLFLVVSTIIYPRSFPQESDILSTNPFSPLEKNQIACPHTLGGKKAVFRSLRQDTVLLWLSLGTVFKNSFLYPWCLQKMKCHIRVVGFFKFFNFYFSPRVLIEKLQCRRIKWPSIVQEAPVHAEAKTKLFFEPSNWVTEPHSLWCLPQCVWSKCQMQFSCLCKCSFLLAEPPLLLASFGPSIAHGN